MRIDIGVVGPHDLVDDVVAICAEHSSVTVRRFDYVQETQAPRIVQANASEVDAWLFTGVVPYTLVREADALTRPAAFVDYTGATLLRALVRLQHDGYDVTRLSIDTVAHADVVATFAEAGLPVGQVRTLPYRVGLTAADVVAFHRRHSRGRRATTAAVTCMGTALTALREEMAVLRLAPSPHSVRMALRQLLLHAHNQAQEDAQIALGLVSLSDTSADRDTELVREAATLGGSVARFADDTHLLVTTRGPLADVTGGFTGLPMLRRLADRHEVVRVGFGVGRSAAEAESLARRALARAGRLGEVTAVLSLRGDTDLVLDSTTPLPGAGEPNLSILARRVGLSVPTLERLRRLRFSVGDEPLTTREVASRLSVQQRTARRMLHRLELAGLAERTGNLTSGGSGRPLTLYRLLL